LTGWNPAEETGSLEAAFEALARERTAATDVKQNQPILVVLGNPPYNAFAGTSPASEGGLVEPYKEGLQDRWGVRKFNLDDLYIRFFRVAERRVAERTGQGIVCFISNYSWLSYGSFVVMRERLLSEFDGIWIDNLNGDSRETGKLTPTGDPDPSVFSTPMNREGIRVGTCITTLVRRAR
jgi:predicted helicase